MAPRSRRVELATGLGYHLLEWGDPQRSELTVILIHGFLDLAWGWEATCAAGLGERFHVVAPDMRGHGDSDRIGAGGYYHFADYVADIDALCEHLPDRPHAVVGHSMGGSIASYFCGTFPERVARLALLEGQGPPEMPVAMPSRFKTWISGWRKARGRSVKAYPDIATAAARLRAHDKRLDQAMAMRLADRGTREVDGGGRAFKHDPLHLSMGPYPFRVELAAELWSAITCPVLLVDAADSAMTLPAAERERRAGYLANARNAVIEDAGHMLQRHQPAALSELLCDFLA